MYGGMRVEVVPDDNAQADPLIPQDVLDSITANEVFVSKVGHMMYVRASLWEKMKDRFQTDPKLLAALAASKETWNRMTSDERESMLRKQRESWCRQDMD